MTLPSSILRARATQASVDRFLGRTHKLSTVDCGRMIGFHLRKCGRKVEMPKPGEYSSYAGALKWLKKRGHDSLESYFDALGLVRIAPAEALMGDILTLESTDALSAPVIYLGAGQYIGFHEDHADAVLMKPTAFAAAWRAV